MTERRAAYVWQRLRATVARVFSRRSDDQRPGFDRGGVNRVRFGAEGVTWERYPFRGARVHPRGTVRWSEIREVDPDANPAEVRIDRETLFVDAALAEELRRAAAEHGVPIVRRVDVWDLLLEPYLDTELDAEHEERTLRLLEETGVPRAEALAIRARVGPRMLAYNAMLWEWGSLGLFDLLHAYRGFLATGLPGRTGDFRAFYREAMEIAARGKVRPPLDDAESAGAPSVDG